MQMVKPEVHEQRQKLILGIAEKHTNERGQIKLTDAFKENPTLRMQLADLKLDTPTRLNAYVLHMRRKGKLPETKVKQRVGNRATGKRKRTSWSDADYSLVHHISRNYRSKEGRGIAWEKAFAEHPEWAKRVGYPCKKAMSFFHRALSMADPGVPFEQNGVHEAVTAPGIIVNQPAPEVCACAICHWAPSPESSVYVNQWQLLAQHYAKEHSKPVKVPPPPPEVYIPKACPECGFNMRVFMAAFQVASKHSGKDGR